MSRARDVADSASVINFVDDVTGNVQSQIDTKAAVVSPTFTGTVTATDFAGDGSALSNISTISGYTFAVVSVLPTPTDPNTVYIVTG